MKMKLSLIAMSIAFLGCAQKTTGLTTAASADVGTPTEQTAQKEEAAQVTPVRNWKSVITNDEQLKHMKLPEAPFTQEDYDRWNLGGEWTFMMMPEAQEESAKFILNDGKLQLYYHMEYPGGQAPDDPNALLFVLETQMYAGGLYFNFIATEDGLEGAMLSTGGIDEPPVQIILKRKKSE